MSKAEHDALEKVWLAEMEGALKHLPRAYQSNARIYKDLEAAGLVFWSSVTTYARGQPPMTVEGWELTELGRATYCMSCKEEGATDGK